MDKEEQKAKWADHAQLEAYLGTINGLYVFHLVSANSVVHSKHFVFDGRIFSIRNFKISIVLDQVIKVHHEHCASDNILRTMLPDIEHAMQESKDDSDMVQASKETEAEAACDERESGDEGDSEMESKAVESHRYPRRNRKLPMRFDINALQRSQINDNPSAWDALKGSDDTKWHSAMQNKVCPLKQLGWSEKVVRTKDKNVLQTKFVWQCKRNPNDDIKK